MLKSRFVLLLMIISIATMIGNAQAHKSEVIGDYKIEVGWIEEPPRIGEHNAIEITVTLASEHEKESTEQDSEMEHEEMEESHDANMTNSDMIEEEHVGEEHTEEEEHGHTNGVLGLSDSLEVDITVNGEKTSLSLAEDPEMSGRYTADYTPKQSGFPLVHIFGKISDTDVETTFHIEKIEGIAPPLKQISSGVALHDVVCNEGLVLIEKISKNTVACVKPSTAEQLALRGWGTIVTEV